MAAPANASSPLILVHGDDDFAVRQRAKEIYQQWCAELGGTDHEIVDAAASNSGEALKAIGKLREALQTLPFFGGAKAIWLRNSNFFGEDRTSDSQAVTESLTSLAQYLKSFSWTNVRLLISAGKVDKRKTFYKTLEKTGAVETFASWSLEDKAWPDQAERLARSKLREYQKEISDEALGELVTCVGPHARLLLNEIEKLFLFVGDRHEIKQSDIAAIVTQNKQARAFALGDALGNRDLPLLLRCLDEELGEIKTGQDKEKSEIGLLYGLITKIRVLIFLKEMIETDLIKTHYSGYDYAKFKTHLTKLSPDIFPEDKRYNPLALNPFVLFKAIPQVGNYSKQELIRAMGLLFKCNQQLVSTSLDEAVALQQTLIKIVQRNPAVATVPK